MTTLTCPCCGQAVASDPMEEARARLSKLERAILDTVVRRPGLPSVEIAARIYADRPDGGPLTANNCVTVAVVRANRKLRPLGLQLRAGRGAGHGYRLEQVA